jgi:ribonuclease BN (tRNA processing enzyme)
MSRKVIPLVRAAEVGGCDTRTGPGVAAVLSAHGGAGALDAIMVTHLHPDHCYDLLPIGISLRRAARPAPLPVYLPRGGRALLHGLGGLFPLGPDPRQDITFDQAFAVQEYRPGQVIRIGGCTISLHGLRHVVANCGIRIQGGPVTIAYTGDTGPGGELLELARDADLLLAEATDVFAGPVHLARPGARYPARRPCRWGNPVSSEDSQAS